MTTTLSQATLLAAIAHFEEEKRRIDGHISECRQQLKTAINETEAPGPALVPDAPKKRTMSATARKAIAAAQKKRWAEHNAAKQQQSSPPVPEAVAKPKRKISAAARKNMATAQQKRFAAGKTMTAGAGA